MLTSSTSASGATACRRPVIAAKPAGVTLHPPIGSPAAAPRGQDLKAASVYTQPVSLLQYWHESTRGLSGDAARTLGSIEASGHDDERRGKLRRDGHQHVVEGCHVVCVTLQTAEAPRCQASCNDVVCACSMGQIDMPKVKDAVLPAGEARTMPGPDHATLTLKPAPGPVPTSAAAPVPG